MPGGRRWRWRGLAGDRLHVLELSESRRVAEGRSCATIDCRIRRRRSVAAAPCSSRASALLAAIGASTARSRTPQSTARSSRCPRRSSRFSKYLEPGSDAFPAEREANGAGGAAARAGRRAARGPDRAASVGRVGCSRRTSAAAACSPSRRARPSAGDAAVRRCEARDDAAARALARRPRVRRGAAAAGRGLARGHGRRVPDHRPSSRDAGRRARPHRRALRHRRRRARRRGASSTSGVWRMSWRRGASGWRVVEWTAASHVTSRAAEPGLHRGHRRPRSAATTRSGASSAPVSTPGWRTIDSVLTRDSNGHHGVSVGDADGDGLDDLYVAQPAGLPNRLYRARGDSHVRGRDRARRARRPRRHGAVALRRRGQRRRPGSRARDRDAGRCSSSTTARAASRPSPDAFRFAAAAPGRADLDRDGRLRPRRLPRSLPVRLLVLLRRGRGQGGHAGAVLRRAQRPARRPLPQRRARALRRRHAGGGPRRGQRPLSLRRGLGRLRRRRLARPAGRERLRHEEPLSQPRAARRAR